MITLPDLIERAKRDAKQNNVAIVVVENLNPETPDQKLSCAPAPGLHLLTPHCKVLGIAQPDGSYRARINIATQPDAWQCTCGNAGHLDGFFPCDETGKEREPDAGWLGLYYCDKCNAIIDEHGGIVGRRGEPLDATTLMVLKLAADRKAPNFVAPCPIEERLQRTLENIDLADHNLQAGYKASIMRNDVASVAILGLLERLRKVQTDLGMLAGALASDNSRAEREKAEFRQALGRTKRAPGGRRPVTKS